MSPLEIIRKGKMVESFQDGEKLNSSQWGKIIGVASSTIKNAAYRGGVQLKEGTPPHPNMPNRVLVKVSKFPELINGFKNARLRSDGYHFHNWALEIDVTAQEFEVKSPNGNTLVYKHPEIDK